jgi:hypothetical protein
VKTFLLRFGDFHFHLDFRKCAFECIWLKQTTCKNQHKNSKRKRVKMSRFGVKCLVRYAHFSEHTPECGFNTYSCNFYTQCGINTHEYDLYTHSVIFTRIVWHARMWCIHAEWFWHARVWFQDASAISTWRV